MFAGNEIALDMFYNEFYQKEEFYADSHGRVNTLEPKFSLNCDMVADWHRINWELN